MARAYACIMREVSSRNGALLGISLLALALFVPGCGGANEPDFTAARARMVEQQLAGPGRGITNARVLAAMREVPRHEFVPKTARSEAYGDHPLPIGHDQTISQPFIVAFMTE